MQIYSSGQQKRPADDSLHFQRTYFHQETQSLTLDGLGGDDVFEVVTAAARPMRLLLYGGEGHDQLRLKGSARRLKSYDEAGELTAAGAPHPSLPRKSRRAYDRLNDD